MDIKSGVKYLLRYDNYLIVTHKNPDGDTMGSAAALCSALRRMGKTAWLYPNRQASDKLLKYAGKYFAPEDYKHRIVICVDIAAESLYPQGFSGGANLCFDHHPSNTHYAKQYLVQPEKASCGEIILELIRELCGDISPEEATLLYIAVSTDTGCFQYMNTTADTHYAAAELYRCGADSAAINLEFFRKFSPARLKLEGMVYSGMEFYREGKISVVTITRDMLEKSGAKNEDLDDLAGLSGRAQGTELSITIRELENGECRVSLRSGPSVNSCDICAFFGGGGHALAAGCTIANTPAKAREILLAVIDEVWK